MARGRWSDTRAEYPAMNPYADGDDDRHVAPDNAASPPRRRDERAVPLLPSWPAAPDTVLLPSARPAPSHPGMQASLSGPFVAELE